MNEDVNGGRMTQAISAVESSFSKITQAIRTREDQIQQLQSQIASLVYDTLNLPKKSVRIP